MKSKTSLLRFFTDPEILLLIGGWTLLFVFVGTPYPYHYDSVNYALAIIDRFHIGMMQPHPPGYFFHVLFGRLVHLFIRNPYYVQQLQNILYLCLVLPCWYLADKRQKFDILFLGSFPLVLFFPVIPIAHAASLAAGCWMAYALFRMEKKEWSPLIPGMIYGVSIGFRQDMLIMLGPVFLYFLIRGKYPLRIWGILLLAECVLFLSWYLPTRLLSSGLDPFEAANMMNSRLYNATSIFLGASLRENVRCSIRFLFYGLGVIGPGGIILLIFIRKKMALNDWMPVLLSLLPILLFGTILLLPYSYYYASGLGFAGTWLLLTRKLPHTRRWLLLLLTVFNISFFWWMPRALYDPWNSGFAQRSMVKNVIKQVRYAGASSRDLALHHRSMIAFADTTVGTCDSFYVESGILWDRIWKYMATYCWNNTLVETPADAQYILGIADTTRPGMVMRSGNIVLYRKVPGTFDNHPKKP